MTKRSERDACMKPKLPQLKNHSMGFYGNQWDFIGIITFLHKIINIVSVVFLSTI